MSKTIKVEVGDFYADLHKQYKQSIGEDYNRRAREQFEDWIHGFNKQIEREMEERQKAERETVNNEQDTESSESAR